MTTKTKEYKSIERIIDHALKQLRHCPYCIQHDKDFVAKYGRAKQSCVFASSPAFKELGQWYHLQVCRPSEKSRGGYNWQKCDVHEHHEYLALVFDYAPTLEDAVNWVDGEY